MDNSDVPVSSVTRWPGHPVPNSSSVTGEEDPDCYITHGFHPVYLGEVYNDKYTIVSKLGWGWSSTVWLAKELASCPPRYVAIKILTSSWYERNWAAREHKMREHLKRTNLSHPGREHVLFYSETFFHDGPNGKHMCLVQDVMGQTVLDLAKQFPNNQLPVQIGRQVATQTLQALHWLHRWCHVAHGHLRSEYILIDLVDKAEAVKTHLSYLKEHEIDLSPDPGLRSRRLINGPISASSKISIRITHFERATPTPDQPSFDSVYLRAPEVLVKTRSNFGKIEIWTFGCVMYELMQGHMLFRSWDHPDDTLSAEEQELVKIEDLFGAIPKSLLRRGDWSSKRFDYYGKLLNVRKRRVPKRLWVFLRESKNPSMSKSERDDFCLFLQFIFDLEPKNRLSADQLLEFDTWLNNEVRDARNRF